jgi:hypothetical protein
VGLPPAPRWRRPGEPAASRHSPTVRRLSWPCFIPAISSRPSPWLRPAAGPCNCRTRWTAASAWSCSTAELIAKHGLEIGVGYGADARALAAATGAFVNDDPLFLQSTGFVLNPAGQVVVGVYSTGAIGRLVPEDVIGLIRYLRAHAA